MKPNFGIIFALIIPLGATVFLPSSFYGTSLYYFFNQIGEVALLFCCYTALPLFFFSMPVAIANLLGKNKVKGTLIYFTLFSLAAYLLLFLFATATITLFPLPRMEVIRSEFPVSESGIMVTAIVQRFLTFQFTDIANLPSFLFFAAFLLGVAFYPDKEIAEPAYNFFDSLSRLFYRINALFVRIIFIPLTFITFSYMIRLKESAAIERHGSLVILLTGFIILFVFLVIPLILRIVGGEKNPFSFVFDLLPMLITSGIAMDYRVSYSMITPLLYNRFRISRDSSAVATPLAFFIARAGTVVIYSLTFLIVYKTYNRLSLDFGTAFYYRVALPLFIVIVVAPTISAGPMSGLPLFFAFSRGLGLEKGEETVLSIIPILASAALILDSAIFATIVYLTALKTEERKDVRFHILQLDKD